MRGIFLPLLSALFCALFSDAFALDIRVSSPGTLASLVGQARKYSLTSLKVSGILNGSDLRFLREMSGCGYDQRPTAGRLRTLDLSDVSFVTGGEAYLKYGGGEIGITSAHTLPPHIFSCSNLRYVVMPVRLDTIGTGAFEFSALRAVTIPEDCYVDNEAFNGCPYLRDVTFPQHLKYLGSNAFALCSSLKSLHLHSIEYLKYHAFENIPALEEVEVDGIVWHVDGWFCYNLPSLRRIVLSGILITTGGSPIAGRCPRLEDIVFSGFTAKTYFGSVDFCPRVSKCTVTGYVGESADDNFLPASHSAAAAPASYLKQIREYMGDSVKVVDKYVNLGYGDVLYALACAYAQKGDRAYAVKVLRKAVERGFDDFNRMRNDSDLASLRSDPEFISLSQYSGSHVSGNSDYIYLLRSAPAYKPGSDAKLPRFTYEDASSPKLRAVREYFSLDSIAGSGDEISKMKNILLWLHNTIRHDGSNGYPSGVYRNSIALYEACRMQHHSLNCRGLALVYTELCLAMGWPARTLTCEPKGYATDQDCHVINMVWSRQLGKWIWLDPTFYAWVTDENGMMLSQREVRERLIAGKPVNLNPEANWNNEQPQTKNEYLYNYMAKNLYYLSASLYNRFETEGPAHNVFFTLSPDGHYRSHDFETADDDWFWQSPQISE